LRIINKDVAVQWPSPIIPCEVQTGGSTLKEKPQIGIKQKSNEKD
jgi:hypothetical protein